MTTPQVVIKGVYRQPLPHIDTDSEQVVGTVEVEMFYFNRAAVIADTIDPAVSAIYVFGYTDAGDGGEALFKRVGSEPGHNGKVSSNGGTVWWELVPDGGEVRIEQFGGKADANPVGGGTDNYTPLQNAIGFVSWTPGANARYSYPIRFRPGRYRIGSMVELHTMTQLKGCTAGHDAPMTELYFPSTTTCFLIAANNTSGETGTGTNLGQSNGSILEGLGIMHYYSGAPFDPLSYGGKHGIHMRVYAELRHLYFQQINGHAIYIHADAGYGGEFEGNVNQFKVRDCFVHSCSGDCLLIAGRDANGGIVDGFITHSGGVGGCGINCNSSFANTFVGVQITGYGNRGVHHAGNRYILVDGIGPSPTATANTTTPGTNNDVWYFIGAGGSSPQFPDWSATGDYSLYRLAIRDSGGGSVYVAPYMEGGGAGLSHIKPPSIVLGGTIIVSQSSSQLQSRSGVMSGLSGVGGQRDFIPGSAEYTRNGSTSWVHVGRGHEEFGFGANGGMQFLTFRRLSDNDASWQWGFRGNDISFRSNSGAQIWEITTQTTAQQHGKGVADPFRLRLFNPVFVDPDDNNQVGAIKFSNVAPGGGAHARGEIVFKNNPTAGGKIGWVCVTAGTPGTWKEFGAIDA